MPKFKSNEESQRWYAKWTFSGYLGIGIFVSLYLIIFNFDPVITFGVALFEITCLLEMTHIFLYSHKEIWKFLKKKLPRL